MITLGYSKAVTKVGKDVDGVYVPKHSVGLIVDSFKNHGILYLLVEFDGFGDECVIEWYSKNQLNLLGVL